MIRSTDSFFGEQDEKSVSPDINNSKFFSIFKDNILAIITDEF